MTLQELLVEFDKRRADNLNNAYTHKDLRIRVENLEWAVANLIEILKDKEPADVAKKD